MMNRLFVLGLALTVGLGACEKVVAPHWMRISPDTPCAPPAAPGGAAAACKSAVFFLDTANITPKSGLLYVTLQTRSEGDTSGDYGIIHAEANCSSVKLEPTALHEERFNQAGQKLTMRLTPTTSAQEQAIVSYACKAAGK
jgi:hypothetical protein